MVGIHCRSRLGQRLLPLALLLHVLLLAVVRPAGSFQRSAAPRSSSPNYSGGIRKAQISGLQETEKTLFPYQEHGVDRLVARKRLLLADEMGLGKTVQSIEAINRIGKEDSIILIICPKSVLGVWLSELETWLDPKLASAWDIHVATTKDKPAPKPGTITILNYDITWRLEKELPKLTYDVLICDECHYLKSMDSKRTKTVLGGKSDPGIQSEYLWLLTGTPVLNRPVELYSLVHAIDPEAFPTFDEYADKYCDPKTRTVYGRGGRPVEIEDYSGASNLGELSKRLEPLMVRRYKMDVLSQLPPKVRSCICLTADQDVAQQERDLLKEALANSNLTAAVLGGMDLDDFGSNADKLMSYLQKDRPNNQFLGLLAQVRQETALRKLRPAFELLDEYTTQEKVVVFVYHRAVHDAVMEHYGNQAVGIIGGMEREDRVEAVRRFQDDPTVRVFVGSIRAAGLGLTLTASSHVVFLEFDWSPGVMTQAEDRCHRVGQAESVRIQYYVFKDTIDEWLSQTLIFKQSSISQILPEKMSGADGIGYVFNFGKHEGLRLEDTPRPYVEYLLKNGVWRNRPDLWRAFHSMDLVSEEPPPERRHVAPERQLPPPPNTQNTQVSIDKIKDLKVDYTFDFGKHIGKTWEDVPEGYRDWLISKKVYGGRGRENLLGALVQAGFDPNQ